MIVAWSYGVSVYREVLVIVCQHTGNHARLWMLRIQVNFKGLHTTPEKLCLKKKLLVNFVFEILFFSRRRSWTLLCSAVIIRSRQYQYKMQHVCKWAIIDMNNLSRLLCCRVEEDQLLYVEGDFFPSRCSQISMDAIS